MQYVFHVNGCLKYSQNVIKTHFKTHLKTHTYFVYIFTECAQRVQLKQHTFVFMYSFVFANNWPNNETNHACEKSHPRGCFLPSPKPSLPKLYVSLRLIAFRIGNFKMKNLRFTRGCVFRGCVFWGCVFFG